MFACGVPSQGINSTKSAGPFRGHQAVEECLTTSSLKVPAALQPWNLEVPESLEVCSLVACRK
jgi:hypothetical protein